MGKCILAGKNDLIIPWEKIRKIGAGYHTGGLSGGVQPGLKVKWRKREKISFPKRGNGRFLTTDFFPLRKSEKGWSGVPPSDAEKDHPGHFKASRQGWWVGELFPGPRADHRGNRLFPQRNRGSRPS